MPQATATSVEVSPVIINAMTVPFEAVVGKLSLGSPGLRPPLHFIVEYPSLYPVSKTVRDTIGYLFDTHDRLRSWKGRFILVVDELVNNSIEHGSLAGEINRLECSLTDQGALGWQLKISVVDTGNADGAKNASQMRQLEAARSGLDPTTLSGRRGRGLFFMVKKLVDILEFSDREEGGLVVSITKLFPAA